MFHFTQWLVGILNKNFMVKLPKCHQCIWVESTLITQECIKSTDSVVTSRLHRSRTVKQEQNWARHLRLDILGVVLFM